MPTILDDVGNGQDVAHPTVYPMTDIRPLRSYGRRKAKPLSARKERLIGELLPRLRLDLETPAPSLLTRLFATRVEDVWLEIGFGSGEHLLWQAETHKDVGFIGCEPFINGLGTLLGAIEDRGIGTIRVHDGDAREVLAWLPDRSIGRIFLLFPDPWPKKRQLKRRLLCADTLGEIATRAPSRRRIQICLRQRRLCRASAAPRAAKRSFYLDSRARDRLAGATARLARNAL